jgi:hypothetical protein
MNRDAISRAKEALNQATSQLTLFLSLDSTVSKLLIDEILTEDDLNHKLDKFVHVVLDRLNFQKETSSPVGTELITSITRLDESCPQFHYSFPKENLPGVCHYINR